MASTPQPLDTAIGITNTVVYDPFIAGGASRAMIVFIHLCNTTTADITVDIFIDKAADKYIADDLLVPAKGTASISGMWTIDSGTSILTAIASAVGVDLTGTVVENA